MADSSARRRAGNGTLARHGRLPRHSATLTALRTLGIAAAVEVVSTTSVVAIAAGSLSDSVETVHLGGSSGKPEKSGPDAMEGAINFVIVGSDTRKGQAEEGDGDGVLLNNDVTMLVRISKDHE